MSKRIFELAKQADLIQWDSLPSGARTPDHESVIKAKRFAELIVAECVTLIRDMGNPSYINDSDWDVSRNDAMRVIREHFRGEE